MRKGETGSMVVFASRFTKSDVDAAGEESNRELPFLKAYTVFNVAQIDGLPDRYYAAMAPVQERHERITEAEALFREHRRRRSSRWRKGLLRAKDRSYADAALRDISRRCVLRCDA